MLNKEYLNEDETSTIYIHDFFMYGMYSEQYNRVGVGKVKWQNDQNDQTKLSVKVQEIISLMQCCHLSHMHEMRL